MIWEWVLGYDAKGTENKRKKWVNWTSWKIINFVHQRTHNAQSKMHPNCTQCIPTEWEKMFTNDKGLISRIYRKLELNNQKNPMQNWVKDLNTYVFTEDTRVAIKHMKRCSTSLVIREMWIKAIRRFRVTFILTATIKKRK